MSLQSIKSAPIGIINKFGRAPAVGITEVGIWTQNTAFPFPQVARSVRIKAGGDVADDAAGLGARSVKVIGIDDNFKIAEEIIVTAGVDASAFSTIKFWRIWRSYTVDVGTYGGLNIDDIVIETETENVIISEILAGEGQSQQLTFSTPDNVKAEITDIMLIVDGPQTVTFRGLLRKDFDIVTAPFSSSMIHGKFPDMPINSVTHLPMINAPITIPPKSDFWITGIASSATSAVAVMASIQLKPL